MDNTQKSMAELMAELEVLRQQVAVSEAKRQQLGQALRKSEQRYRALFENTNDAVVIISFDQYLIDVNQKTVQMFGYDSVEEMVGRPTSDFVFAEGMVDHYLKHQVLLDGGSLPVYEQMLVCKDGALLPVEINLTVAYDDDGNPSYVQGMIRDISECKQAEEAYHNLVDNSLQGLAILQEGQLVFCNHRYAAMRGYTVDEMLAQPPGQLFASVHPEDRARVQSYAAARFAGKPAPAHYESRIIRKDGQMRWLESYHVTIQYQGNPAIQSLFMDITERKQMENELRSAVTRYQALFENAPIGIALSIPHSNVMAIDETENPVFTYDDVDDFRGSNVLMINEAFERLYGLSKEEIDRMNPYMPYQHPEDRDRMLQQLKQDGLVKNYEVARKRPDGTTYHSSVTIVPFPAGGEGALLLMEMDITDSKKMEAALRQSEERYRTITEFMSDYAFVGRVEPDGRWWTEWSTESSFHRLTGYTSQDINHSMQLYHPEDAKIVEQHLQETIQGKATEGEYRIFTKSGELRWLHLSRKPVWDDRESRVVRFYGIAQDITARKQAEQSMRESEKRYRALFESVPVGISLSVLNGPVLMINSAMGRMLGYTQEELTGFNPHMIYQKAEDRDSMIAQLKRDGFVKDFEILMRHKDGTLYFASMTIMPFPAAHPDAVITIMLDITERKQIEQEQLALALERERVQIVTNFITQASHEFRTPLSTINTSMYLLGKVIEPDVQKRHICTVEQQVKNITVLVEMLTMMARLDGGESIVLQPVNLIQIIRSVFESQKRESKKRGVEFVLVFSEGSLFVNGHAEYLNEAIRQLMNNAIRFTPAGGTVTVRSQRVNNTCLLEVQDTGLGIGEDLMPHIFERFRRQDVSGTTRGFGLGLPIVKAVVDHHNGRIDVETEVGKGSTFRLVLPAYQPETDAPA